MADNGEPQKPNPGSPEWLDSLEPVQPQADAVELKQYAINLLEGALRHQGIKKPVTEVFYQDVNDLVTTVTALLHTEREGADKQLALIKTKLHKLNAGIIAVDFYLNKPYPDDPRWTPYTRFVGPRLKMLSAAVFNNEDISELEAMARLTNTEKEIKQ